MAGNTSTIVFAGDAKGVQQAAKQADDAIESVGSSADAASSDFESAGQASQDFNGRLGSLGAGISGMQDAVDSAGAALQGLVDIQNYSKDRAAKLARAQADVEQAMLDGRQAAIDLETATNDLNQAQADGRQAGIDLEQSQIDIKQAQLDAAEALKAYNDAVKEHGKDSAEAKQAAIDLKQANLDQKQAVEDGKQAQLDANQAITDAKQYTLDGAQALRDGKDAQLNLNDAMREANPSGLQQWADKLNLVTPLLSGLIGIMGLVTAAQWLWNTAVLANPITWIIVGIVALVAVIVVIATKTTWFQSLWKAAWGAITTAARAVADWFMNTLVPSFKRAFDQLKGAGQAIGRFFTQTIPNYFRSSVRNVQAVWGAITGWFSRSAGTIRRVFSGIGDGIKGAFRSAFNYVARAWNNTVGRLSFTVPGWVPGIGGNSVQAPRLPQFHAGGRVPGVPGSEVVAVLQAGETVSTAASSIGNNGEWISIRGGDPLIDTLIEIIARRIDDRGGRAAQLGIRVV